ncbi:tRNA-binding protein [Mangrovimonas sp. AS39]|uniref:tRNA-binding protein n=1 Tax=Mangrovimonas futianensis TaxID=2895523 RepID=UPI001E456CEA|nr:tRNA-binding protein [Mangrovimonas futianensis]MCF1191187.1 tRNA-binding protein [Mangrovimonas futianensis]MCF1194882.1 tRNA-binding protein [Mangrovimonas futianensis]
MKPEINFEAFVKVDLRVGTIIEVNDFPEARKPAYQMRIDFGTLGIRKTSAQITQLYTKEDLLGRQIVAVVNFPRKQIAQFMSECLVMGAVKEKDVMLLHPEQLVPNGSTVS